MYSDSAFQKPAHYWTILSLLVIKASQETKCIESKVKERIMNCSTHIHNNYRLPDIDLNKIDFLFSKCFVVDRCQRERERLIGRQIFSSTTRDLLQIFTSIGKFDISQWEEKPFSLRHFCNNQWKTFFLFERKNLLLWGEYFPSFNEFPSSNRRGERWEKGLSHRLTSSQNWPEDEKRLRVFCLLAGPIIVEGACPSSLLMCCFWFRWSNASAPHTFNQRNVSSSQIEQKNFFLLDERVTSTTNLPNNRHANQWLKSESLIVEEKICLPMSLSLSHRSTTKHFKNKKSIFFDSVQRAVWFWEGL